MSLEIIIPEIGESITEVTLSTWLKADGEYVNKDEEIFEIESEKATFSVPALTSGILRIQVQSGEIAKVGAQIGLIETGKETSSQNHAKSVNTDTPKNIRIEEPVIQASKISYATKHPSTAAKKMIEEKGLHLEELKGSGKEGRITKQDVLAFQKNLGSADENSGREPNPGSLSASREIHREKISNLRKKISENLVRTKNEAAALTSFNEVDMSALLKLREEHQELFLKTHGVKLGFMSFFIRALCESLKEFSALNAKVEGNEFLFYPYVDLGFSVSTDKGLVVPVIRDAQTMGLADLEKEVARLAHKARNHKLSLEDLAGGTFTLTNGGVFGSLLSTPMLNAGQSGILGMHNIVERPVAIEGKVEIRPMMYIALTYDHRMVDGREAVSFLIEVKNILEDPFRLLLS